MSELVPNCGQCRACDTHHMERLETLDDQFLSLFQPPRFIVCATCGNKRCPHATDHRFPCTGSNEPNQPGSEYQFPYFRDDR